MADLAEGQFELDGSLLMSGHRDSPLPIGVADLDTGNAEPRAQDADNPVSDGQMFGRDYYSAPTWTFELNVQGVDPADTLAQMDALKAAWRADAIRAIPGATSVLRYNLKGRTRRVYGRGRRLSETVRQGLMDGVFMPALAEFQLVDPLHYDDTQAGLSLSLVTDLGAGTTWPVTWPVTWGAQTGLRQGVVNVAGDAAVPFTATIYGPMSGKAVSPYVAGPGWRVELTGLEVAYDQQVVIDTRAGTVLRNGASVAGSLSRASSLKARLAPGSQELVFGCVDPTNTARAVVSWRPGYWSI